MEAKIVTDGNGKGRRVSKCPIYPDDLEPYCYQSCAFYNFVRDQCEHDKMILEGRGPIPRDVVGQGGES